MIKNIRILIFTLLALLSLAKANASGIDSTVIFKFMSQRDIFWANYEGNKSEFVRLARFIQSHRNALMRGKYPINVQGYCASYDTHNLNAQVVKIRSNRVKSHMITMHGLREENFKTTNFTTTCNGERNIVLVIFKLEKDLLEAQNYQSQSYTQDPNSNQFEEYPELDVVETNNHSKSDTLYICAHCADQVDLSSKKAIIYTDNVALHNHDNDNYENLLQSNNNDSQQQQLHPESDIAETTAPDDGTGSNHLNVSDAMQYQERPEQDYAHRNASNKDEFAPKVDNSTFAFTNTRQFTGKPGSQLNAESLEIVNAAELTQSQGRTAPINTLGGNSGNVTYSEQQKTDGNQDNDLDGNLLANLNETGSNSLENSGIYVVEDKNNAGGNAQQSAAKERNTDIGDNTATFVFETPDGFNKKTNQTSSSASNKQSKKQSKKQAKIQSENDRNKAALATNSGSGKYTGTQPNSTASKTKPSTSRKLNREIKASAKASQDAKLNPNNSTAFKASNRPYKSKSAKPLSSKKQKELKFNSKNGQTFNSQKTIRIKRNRGPLPVNFELKTNLLYLLATTANLELETLFAKDMFSVNLEGQYANTNWKDNTQRLRLWSASPEFRYYPIKNKLFIGAYASYTNFNIKMGSTGQQGTSAGAGITLGAKIPVGRSLGFEFSLSAGCNKNLFDKYDMNYGTTNYINSYDVNYFGPTKAKISLIWRIGGNKK